MCQTDTGSVEATTAYAGLVGEKTEDKKHQESDGYNTAIHSLIKRSQSRRNTYIKCVVCTVQVRAQYNFQSAIFSVEGVPEISPK